MTNTDLTPATLIGDHPVASLSAAADVGSAGSRDNRVDRLRPCLALAFALLGGMTINLIYGVTPAILLALVFLPVWVGALRRTWGGLALLAVGTVALVWGIALSVMSSGTHIIDERSRFTDSFLLVGMIMGIGMLAWTRHVLSLRTIGVVYGLGLFVQEFLTLSPTALAEPLKQFWIFPIAIIMLALTSASPRVAPDAIVLLLLAAVCGFSDARSYSASFLVALVLRLWESRPRQTSHRASLWLNAGCLAGVAAATYWLVQSLLVGGYLGEQAQIKTEAQLQATGSLLLGGRPELAGTLALMRHDIYGQGVGVLPNGVDRMIVKTGMAAINYNVNNNGYVDIYMLGSGFEMHSMIGDVWSRWGLAGLVLLGLIVGILVRGMLIAVADSRASGLLLFLGCWELWNTVFSPLLSAFPTTVLVMALVLPPCIPTGEDAADRRDW